MNWVTIQSYTYAHEAHLDQILLQNEGIDTFLKDEFTNQIDNFMSNAIGGVKLQVQKKDVVRAQQILSIQAFDSTERQDSSFVSSVIILANKIPYVRHLKPEPKIGITLGIIVTVITVCVSLMYYLFSK